VWTRHVLVERLEKYGKSRESVEKVIRTATTEYPERKGCISIYGCADGSYLKVILCPGRKQNECKVVTIVPRGLPCD
jgi:hypothetical protein